MAISKQQPMRPALDDCIDALNISTDTLTQEILDRQSADSTLQGNIDTVSDNLAQEVLDRQSADSTLQGNIDEINAKYRIGEISVTVPVNDSVTDTVIYTPAFDVATNIMLIWQLNIDNADLTVTVTQVSTGFNVAATNASTTDAITFVLSYLAIGVI